MSHLLFRSTHFVHDGEVKLELCGMPWYELSLVSSLELNLCMTVQLELCDA
jgi:hypothetical protein